MATCWICGGAAEFEAGRWFHSRIDDGTHDAEVDEQA